MDYNYQQPVTPDQPISPSQYGYNQQPAQITEDMLPPQYKPIGAWGYFGWNLLFAIPIAGLIVLIVFACGGVQNVNLRNYARSFFCGLVIALVIFSVVIMLGVAGIMSLRF